MRTLHCLLALACSSAFSPAPALQSRRIDLLSSGDETVVGVRVDGAEVVLFTEAGRPRRWAGAEVVELGDDEVDKLGLLLAAGQRWVSAQNGDVVAKGRDRSPSTIDLEFLPTGEEAARRLRVEDLQRFCGSESGDGTQLGVEVLSALRVGLRTGQGLTVVQPGDTDEVFSLPLAERYIGSPDGRWQLALQEKLFRLYSQKGPGAEIGTGERPSAVAFSPDGAGLALLGPQTLRVFRVAGDGTVEQDYERTFALAATAADDQRAERRSADLGPAGDRVAVGGLRVLRRARRGPDGSLVPGLAEVTVKVLDDEGQELLVDRFETDRWDRHSPRVRLSEDGALVVALLPKAAYGWVLP